MIIIDLFDIDIHIFTVIKFLFNLVVKFKYIYNQHPNDDYDEDNSCTNTSLWERKSIGSNDI